MPKVTDAALKERARQLLVDMTTRERWIYALPDPSAAVATVAGVLADAGIAEIDSAADGHVRKYQDGSDGMHILVFDHQGAGMVLVEARGAAAVPHMQRILERTGFVPQSKLWGAALSISNEDAAASLTLLAHMAVAWDEDWSDLFILHLASPDPIVRHEAVKSLLIAAMVSGEPAPGLTLLREGHQREQYPQLRATIGEAVGVLEAFGGDPVSLQEASEGG